MNSLQLWKIFVPSVGNQGDDEMRYKRLALPDKSGRLSDGIKPMTSPSFAWITFLSLANICCTRAELIRISRVANLGMLTINPLYGEYFGEEIGLDNSLVRAWGRAAFEAGAFSKLRILVLNDVTCRFLTNSVFKYLREFPALGMLLVPADFQDIFDDAAVAHGWYRIKNSDLFRTRFESENCTWQDIYTDCFNDDGTVDLVKLENLQSPDGNAPPVLDVIYGNTKNDPYSKLIPRNDIGKETLQIFVRRDRTVRILNDDKKRIRPTYEDADHSWFKKRAMRSSKQQHIGALLADFDK
ncbi:MAG: hypothetical protein LQ350_000981 [Teloschistes chrysophthalmus]|nr:MAG: hypothetical protein LQ350_000981 [Niorma chrysophthalma]